MIGRCRCVECLEFVAGDWPARLTFGTDGRWRCLDHYRALVRCGLEQWDRRLDEAGFKLEGGAP